MKRLVDQEADLELDSKGNWEPVKNITEERCNMVVIIVLQRFYKDAPPHSPCPTQLCRPRDLGPRLLGNFATGGSDIK